MCTCEVLEMLYRLFDMACMYLADRVGGCPRECDEDVEEYIDCDEECRPDCQWECWERFFKHEDWVKRNGV